MDTNAVKELRVVKDKVKDLNDQVKDLEAVRHNLEAQIIEDMDLDGMSLARTDHGTVSITRTEIASVKDWALYGEYILENKALHLLQRRTSNAAYREEVALKGEIPGVETFTKKSLSLTNKVT